jgi:hypothetical protein
MNSIIAYLRSLFTRQEASLLGKYGWKAQTPDFRDYPYVPKSIPPVGQESLLPALAETPVLDQGHLGSCVSNALARVLMYQGYTKDALLPARLFIYYEGRKAENSIRSDSGLVIRDGIKVVATYGAPPELTWPYIISKFTRKPPVSAYIKARLDKALTYYSLDAASQPRRDLIRAAIHEGYPVIFGFSVYDSLETQEVANTGIVPMPAPTDKQLGGHCVFICGYDDTTQRYQCANSWSENWGNHGYFYLPYAYVENPQLASDFWIITQDGA